MVCPEMAHRVKNPKCPHTRSLRFPPHCFVYGSEILFLPQHYARRQSNFGINHILLGQPLQEMTSRESIVFRCLELARDPNVAAQKFIESSTFQIRLNL